MSTDASAHQQSSPPGAHPQGAHPEGPAGEIQHGASDKKYIVIAAILALITAAEVTLSYIDVGALFLPALLIMMIAKFVTVVSYFMHLKFDNRVFSVLFYMGLLLAVFVYIVALTTFHFFDS